MSKKIVPSWLITVILKDLSKRTKIPVSCCRTIYRGHCSFCEKKVDRLTNDFVEKSVASFEKHQADILGKESLKP
jgi:hypothetical protein